MCEKRDRKGLYRLAREGRIQNFTGISADYETPETPEIIVDTSVEPLEDSVSRIIARLPGRR